MLAELNDDDDVAAEKPEPVPVASDGEARLSPQEAMIARLDEYWQQKSQEVVAVFRQELEDALKQADIVDRVAGEFKAKLEEVKAALSLSAIPALPASLNIAWGELVAVQRLIPSICRPPSYSAGFLQDAARKLDQLAPPEAQVAELLEARPARGQGRRAEIAEKEARLTHVFCELAEVRVQRESLAAMLARVREPAHRRVDAEEVAQWGVELRNALQEDAEKAEQLLVEARNVLADAGKRLNACVRILRATATAPAAAAPPVAPVERAGGDYVAMERELSDFRAFAREVRQLTKPEPYRFVFS